MRHSSEFWEVLFSLREGATLALLNIFTIGVMVLGLMSNLVYGLLAQPDGLNLSTTSRVVITCGALLAVAYGLYRQERRKPRQLSLSLDESRLAPPHRGLIWLLGPGPVDHTLCAIRHHAQAAGGQRLEHCWLVMQRGSSPVQQACNLLATRMVEEGLDVRLEPVMVDRLDVEAAYEAVRRVFEREAPAEGLAERDVIADITGGTKPMTAGMVLAALDGARELEYIESQRDEKGAPIPGTLRVVWVDKAFRLENKRTIDDGQTA